jgi:hypothetical protein
MQFDADAYALARTAEEITHTYTDEVPPPDNIFIISNLASALQAVQNPWSIKAHSSALRFHRALTTFTLHHSFISFYLIWSPADSELEGFQMASTWAAAACLHDPPNGVDRIQSAAFRKDRARTGAFLNWEMDFHRERCISDFWAAVTGHPTNGHAHTHVILEAPSTHHHPLWAAAIDMEKDERGKKTKRPLYSRCTTSTALQITVDHTFTGSYTQRFHPADPPKHSHVHAALPSAHHNISHGNVRCSIKHGLTTPFTPTAAPSHTVPFTTPILTNSSRFYKTVMLHRVPLISVPQWK